ncbi:hypothetical protein AVW15_09475 [Chelatococcus daeguensis]|nr:hypothetical protein AVW15_09475 [Chelatococcus daeguensis]
MSGTESPRPMLAASGPALARAPAAAPAMEPAVPQMRLARFEDLVALAGERRDIGLKRALERDVRLAHFEDGHVEFALVDGASKTLAGDLSRRLQEWTGRRWVVSIARESDTPTLHEKAEAEAAERLSGVAGHPLVQAVMQRFPGAAIVDVRNITAEEAPAQPVGEGLAPADEELYIDDDF